MIESSRVTQYVIQVHTYSSIIIHFKTTDYVYTFFKVKKGEFFLQEKYIRPARLNKAKQNNTYRIDRNYFCLYFKCTFYGIVLFHG